MEVDKENLRSLSNDDLFKIMKKYGINVGPVNVSTRSVYEKKLKSYLESIENGQNMPTSQSNGNSNIINNNNNKQRKEEVAILTARLLDVPDYNSTATPPKSTANKNFNSTINVPAPQEPPKTKRHTLEPSAFQQAQKLVETTTSTTTIRQPSTILTAVYDDVLSSRVSVSSSSNGISSTKTVVAEVHSSTQQHKADTPYPSQARTQSIQERSNKPVETRKPDLDFKLIRPSTPTSAASTSYASPSVLQTNLMGGKDMNRDYGLLDDRQPATLSSSYRQQETTTNIRSRATISQLDKPVHMNPTARDESKTFQSAVKPQGNSGFNFKYILLIGILFVIVYYLLTQMQSNPDNPVEFLN